MNSGAERPADFQPAANPAVEAAATANVIVLAEDVTLLELMKHSLEGRQRVWRADDALHAADLLVAAHSGILFIDAALMGNETPTLVDRLHEQFPDFPIVVTGRRDDEVGLGERISTGAVFRFLHKPVSADRVRNFIDAAARRSGEQPPREPAAEGTSPSAPSRAFSAVRSISLPRIRTIRTLFTPNGKKVTWCASTARPVRLYIFSHNRKLTKNPNASTGMRRS